jgi:UDP-N-acetyl-D-mannosaminuronic acid transferase (WecB/TagA/CpsF family)
MGHKWFNIIQAQDGYSEFDWSAFEKQEKIENPINIMLIARWTPTQELRVQKHFSKIKSNHFIVFTVWWLFDFIASANSEIKWTQKRAPKIVRDMKLEWLWRLITDPKRNYIKVKNSLAIFPYIFKYLVLKKK